ncbi:unnamed protein product [Calicophoron daubneyi]|uniref:DUF4806 domain-containing protein n=1 Tax=Calicophoron daubneyi TaxID=300641 RepID=A0AAV2T3J0_CALDB
MPIFSTSAVTPKSSLRQLQYPPPIQSGRVLYPKSSRQRLQSPSVIQSRPVLTPKSSIRRLQSPPGNISESIRASHSPTNLCLSGESVFSLKEMHKALIGLAASVARIDENCKYIRESMDSLHTGDRNAAVTPSNCPSVPIYTMEQLIALNSNLDEEMYNRGLSEQLRNVSGGDLRTLVRNALSRLISPSVSEDIHCTGKSRPFVFKNSRLHGFVLNLVCQRPGFATVSAKAVNTEARLWFKLRREQRRSKNHQAINLFPENICELTDEGEEVSYPIPIHACYRNVTCNACVFCARYYTSIIL